LVKRYSLTLDEYNALLAGQNHKCAICGKDPDRETRRFCVDHDHQTGKVRGLLCNKCNVGLANFTDNPGTLRAAAHYLEMAALKAVGVDQATIDEALNKNAPD